MKRSSSAAISRMCLDRPRVLGTHNRQRQRDVTAQCTAQAPLTEEASCLHRKVRGALVRAGSIAAPHCMRLSGRRYHVRSLWYGDQLLRFWVDDGCTGAQILAGDVLGITLAPLQLGPHKAIT